MKVIVNRPVELDVKHLFVRARVRYPEDSTLRNLPEYDWIEDDADQPKMPCMSYMHEKRRGGDWYWCPVIELETGKIINWRQGVCASISYKVVDEFDCYITDSDDKIVARYNGYVPSFMAIDDAGYGDYVYLTINEDGYIENWSFDEYDFKKLDEAEE